MGHGGLLSVKSQVQTRRTTPWRVEEDANRSGSEIPHCGLGETVSPLKRLGVEDVEGGSIDVADADVSGGAFLPQHGQFPRHRLHVRDCWLDGFQQKRGGGRSCSDHQSSNARGSTVRPEADVQAPATRTQTTIAADTRDIRSLYASFHAPDGAAETFRPARSMAHETT